MKNTSERIDIRVSEAENQISDLKYKKEKIFN